LLVDAALPFRYPFEVFHHIRHIGAVAVDACLYQGSIEQLARRSDKRSTDTVLLVTWLFANQHNLRLLISLAKDGLGAGTPQVTRLASCGCFAHLCHTFR